MNHRKNDEDAAERQALRHLLLSFPELRVQHDGREVLDSLVEGAAVHLLNEKGAGALLTASDIVGVIRGLTDLEYSRNEVVGSLERLEDRKTLQFRDASHRSFVFDDDRYVQLKEEIRDRGNRVDRAMEGWKEELRSRHSIDVDQVNLLAAKLEHLLGVLAHNYGAEAASLLYSSTPAGKMRFYDALNAEVPEVEHDLPEMLRPIARKEFFKFFDGAPSDRRAVIVDRLNAAFFFHLLSIDPQAAELVRSRFEDKVLYLDTNVLFRLLGLQGPTLAYPATILMSSAEELGIEIRVAQESVEEFHRSLRYEMDRLRAAPITRDAYQRVAAEHPADEWDFMAAYYRLYHSGQVSDPGDFERRFSQLTAYLEDWGVVVDEDAVLSAGESESDPFIDRRSLLNTWTGQRKSAGALDHDTFMPIHVRELRGTGPATPSEARYWFLTFDSRLTPFEVHHPLDDGEVPPCMMVQDWIQVVRPFLARTDDYERAFVSMLAQPLLFRRASGPVGFPHVAEALHRLEKFEELPVPVVTAMIADDAFVRRLNEAKTEEQERKVVEIAAMRAAEKVAEQNDALSREVQEQQGRLATLERRTHDLAQEVEEKTGEVQQERAARIKAEAGSGTLERTLEEERAEWLEELQELKESHRDDLNQLRHGFDQTVRWIVFSFAATLVAVAAGAYWWNHARDWPLIQEALFAVWVAVVLLGLLAIPLRRLWMGVAGVVLGLLGLVVASVGAVGSNG